MILINQTSSNERYLKIAKWNGKFVFMNEDQRRRLFQSPDLSFCPKDGLSLIVQINTLAQHCRRVFWVCLLTEIGISWVSCSLYLNSIGAPGKKRTMENQPSLQALKKKLRWLKLKLRWLVGKASDGKTITEKTQKRWCRSQSQIYEEVFSSEISFVLRHWQRKEEMKFREDFRVYEDCCDDKDKKKCHSYGGKNMCIILDRMTHSPAHYWYR